MERMLGSLSLGDISLLACLLLLLVFIARNRTQERPVLRSVAIVVLGDIGRSPRMMYHAESFAKSKFQTFLIGYKGSKPISSLLSHPQVHLLYISEPPNILLKLPFVLSAPLKIIYQIATITALIIRISTPPEFILVQNPPSIPTLALVWLVGKIRGSKVIIDWHNLGYSILALKLGQTHPFVRLAKKFEAYFGRSAYAHLFVTQAMHDHLVDEWDLQGYKAVLHDRPPSNFHKATPSESHEILLRLQPSLLPLRDFLPSYDPPYATPFTRVATGSRAPSQSYSNISMPSFRDDRPALLVSSTSWTPDEDFSILLEALGLYEKRAREVNGENVVLPKVLVAVTGKGPDRNKYMKEVGKLEKEWKWVRCISLWLESGDYPLFLGTADLGVCLHKSSSALDLPMKIVDMFGCGLPVCALDFLCLHELVKDGVNGLVFKNAQQLAEQLEALLTSFPSPPALNTLRSSLVVSSNRPLRSSPSLQLQTEGGAEHWEWNSWTDNWNKVMRPLILHDVQEGQGQWIRS